MQAKNNKHICFQVCPRHKNKNTHFSPLYLLQTYCVKKCSKFNKQHYLAPPKTLMYENAN